jgi:hypothetical protein
MVWCSGCLLQVSRGNNDALGHNPRKPTTRQESRSLNSLQAHLDF